MILSLIFSAKSKINAAFLGPIPGRVVNPFTPCVITLSAVTTLPSKRIAVILPPSPFASLISLKKLMLEVLFLVVGNKLEKSNAPEASY